MQDNLELIVHFDNNNNKIGYIILLFIIFEFCVFYEKSFLLYDILGYYLTILVQIFLIFNIILFSLGFIINLFFIDYNEPATVLNKNGIWIKHFGLISWDNINKINILHKNHFEYIVVETKDSSKVFLQASLFGKLGFFWSKIFKNPPILISNISLKNHEVINFAKQFMELH